MRNAVIKTATGSVVATGYTDFTSQLKAGEEQVAVNPGAIEIEGVSLRYQKIVGGEFVEMTESEKGIVDASTPVAVVQRKTGSPELVVANGGTDAATGFASAIGGVITSRPLKAGDYQLLVTFEMAMVANATWGATGPDRAAQARLLWNGVEIATWINPFAFYSAFSVVAGDTLAEGFQPTIDLQVRRFGNAGSARIRRVRLELAPTLAAKNSL